jgi:hypothetical protein
MKGHRISEGCPFLRSRSTDDCNLVAIGFSQIDHLKKIWIVGFHHIDGAQTMLYEMETSANQSSFHRALFSPAPSFQGDTGTS